MLKKRIILINVISMLIAFVLCDMVTILLVYRNNVADVSERYQRDLDETATGLGSKYAANGDLETLKFYLKRQEDYYLVCYKTSGTDEDYGEKVYNHTLYGYDFYGSVNYKKNNVYLRFGDKVYAPITAKYMDLRFYYLCDVTTAFNKTWRTALVIVGVTVTVFAIMLFILIRLTKRILDPVASLKERAIKLSEGIYDTGIEITSKDEIGDLSRTFDTMAEKIKLREEELSESERRKTLLMANLSHELRTPMTSMSGYAELLLNAKLSEEDRETALMYMQSECGRLSRLSGKMMKLLSLDQDQELVRKKVSASKLFANVCRICGGVADDRNIRLICSENGEDFTVDEDLMTEVLVNLVDNAIKASPEGAEITITARDKSISVTDKGRGIPGDEIHKILEPFYMVDKSRSRKSGGAGLGLAIVKLILERHNATLDIDSTLGEGTSMNLHFV